MSDMKSWTMGQLMELATGYWPAAALSAGVELGVFEALSGGKSHHLPELASMLQTSERGLAELLNTLVAMDLLVRSDDGIYALAAGAAPLLDVRSPSCQLDALRFNVDLYPLWGRLAQSVKSGAPALPPAAHLGQDPARTRRFVLGMQSRALGLAPELISILPTSGLGGCRLLDVGAGPGTFSRMLAERTPELQVVQFDLSAATVIAQELGATSPAHARLSWVSGDYRKDALPAGPFDVVLYCGALHQENMETALSLFRRIRAVVKPGGFIWVVDIMTAPGRRGPAFAHLFSLQMLLTSPFGRVFGEDETVALLQGADFSAPQITRCPHIPYTLVAARA